MSKKTEVVETINNDVVKEEVIPEKVTEAYDSLIVQAKKFNEERIRATTMETKVLGALEVMIQMYPKLQEQGIES